MMNRLRHLRQDERGMTLIIVGVGFMSFMAATTLAIDVGMFMTARTQSQAAADAGALAGAVALAFNNNTDHSSNGPAVQSAMNTALASANGVMGAPVSITSADVTFEPDGTGQLNRVRVQVFRTAARGNAVPTLIGSIFGMTGVDIGASATAEAVLANAASCVKPWTIPDKWIERQTPPWDTGDTFSAFPSNPSVFPDIYRNASQPTYTGYTQAGQVGQTITLTPEVGTTINPSMYFTLRLPGAATEADYVNNIGGCESAKMDIGNALTIETAATTADTVSAVNALIAADPGASWNSSEGRVVSTFNPSPRVVVVPLYDPLYFDQGKKAGNNTQLRITNFVGFFIDHLAGNNIVGRITPVAGLVDANAGPAPSGAFAHAIRLVQ